MKKDQININNLSDLFFEFQSKIQFFERKFLKEFGIVDVTPNEVKVLYIIGLSNIKSMSEIANRLRITQGTLSITVNSLVKKGYVERTRNKQDRRVIILYLTKKSLSVIKHYAMFYYSLIKELVNNLDEDKATVLNEIFEKLNQIIETNFYEGIEEYEENNE